MCINRAILPLKHSKMGKIIPKKAKTQLLRNPNLLHRANHNLQKTSRLKTKISAIRYFQI